MQIRLLPSLIVVAALTLTVKLGGIYQDIGIAFAQAPPAAAPAPQPAMPPAGGQPAAAVPPAAGGAQASASSSEAVPSLGRSSRMSARDTARDPSSFTPAEIEILQQLSERRAEIDRRAEEVNQREIVLKATEQRIEERIGKLEEIQKTIDGLLKKYDEQEETKLKSLVRIYETMKPKEAARIFEQMEMPVLLSVIDRMKERSAAPVLAAMDPAKANLVTVALAEKRQLPAVSN
jgi:flagellar motility protein MotE (MotC chaperone)